MKTHYLYPGQLIVCEEETLVTTLLGSCVSVVLHDAVKGLGGLNHYLLDILPDFIEESPRYGSFAIPEVLRQLENLGSLRENLVAKIYGGANVAQISIGGETIGEKNILFAQNFLREWGIPIVEQDVGGNSSRTLKFNSHTGTVSLVKGEESLT